MLTGHLGTDDLTYPTSMTLSSVKIDGRRRPSSIVTLHFASPAFSAYDEPRQRPAGRIRFNTIQLDIPAGRLAPGIETVWIERDTLDRIAAELAALSTTNAVAEISAGSGPKVSLTLNADSTEAIHDFRACVRTQY